MDKMDASGKGIIIGYGKKPKQSPLYWMELFIVTQASEHWHLDNHIWSELRVLSGLKPNTDGIMTTFITSIRY